MEPKRPLLRKKLIYNGRMSCTCHGAALMNTYVQKQTFLPDISSCSHVERVMYWESIWRDAEANSTVQ